MTVDFKETSALVEAEDSAGFDATEIAPTIRRSGYAAQNLKLRARGVLVKHEERWALEMPGKLPLVILSGVEKGQEPEVFTPEEGMEIEAEGTLADASEGQLPSMEVESWKALRAEPAETEEQRKIEP